jgi:hypothetical protein
MSETPLAGEQRKQIFPLGSGFLPERRLSGFIASTNALILLTLGNLRFPRIVEYQGLGHRFPSDLAFFPGQCYCKMIEADHTINSDIQKENSDLVLDKR